MLRTEEVQVFKFDELSSEVKDKVLDDNRYWNVEGFDWWDCEDMLLEPTVDEKKIIGIKNGDIYTYSGSKFDALFTYTLKYFSVDRDNYIILEDFNCNNDELFRRLLRIPLFIWEYTYLTTINGNYSNQSTELVLELDIPDDESEDISSYLEQVSEAYYDTAIAIWEDMMHEAVKRLSKHYDWLMSDESVKESVVANELEFLSNGDKWP